MARPTVIQDETILEAARAVFLERGALATSAEVAQRAGVSEGSLFKRFRTKAELFRAAMGLDLDEGPRAMLELVSKAGRGRIEDNLVEAGLALLGYLERIMPIMMMSWSNPKLSDCIPASLDVPDPPPLRTQARIAAYLTAERDLGRIGPEVDAEVVARAFLGAMNTYVFFEIIARRQGAAPIERQRYVEGYARVLAAGLEAGVRAVEPAGAEPARAEPAITRRPRRQAGPPRVGAA